MSDASQSGDALGMREPIDRRDFMNSMLLAAGGALLGGLFLGLLENLGIWKLPSEWQSAISFGVFLLFIVLRPRGFFGRSVQSADI